MRGWGMGIKGVNEKLALGFERWGSRRMGNKGSYEE